MYVEQKKKDGRSFPSIHLEFYVLGSYIYQYGYKSIEHGKTTVPIFIFKSLSHVKFFFREHENTNFSPEFDLTRTYSYLGTFLYCVSIQNQTWITT